MMKHKIGVYGMGVMGKNLALNIASKGYTTSIYNRDFKKTQEVVLQSRDENIEKIHGFEKIDTFVKSLETPRKIIIMVKAGDAVDDVLRDLGNCIDKNDIIIDGGNEWYEKTETRQLHIFDTYGSYLIGMGVSGGAEGARYGPSLMPSGNKDAFEQVKPILESIAARSSSDTHNICMTYIGTGGSGNYVKMVHNGIEYGIMQIIAEIYHILKTYMGYSNEQMACFFEKCNNDIQSYLLEITVDILRKKDEDDESYLLDNILDSPKMNGTGTWTSKEGYETCVPVPNIHSAVDARMISAEKQLRMSLAKMQSFNIHKNVNTFYGKLNEDDICKSMILSIFLCYVQGFILIKKKNEEKSWGVNIINIANIWKGGCIIRSRILDHFSRENIDLKEELTCVWVKNGMPALSKLVTACSLNYIPIPTLTSSFQYVLQYCQESDASNLIQAQRDYFGAHGYQKSDAINTHVHFSTKWK